MKQTNIHRLSGDIISTTPSLFVKNNRYGGPIHKPTNALSDGAITDPMSTSPTLEVGSQIRNPKLPSKIAGKRLHIEE